MSDHNAERPTRRIVRLTLRIREDVAEALVTAKVRGEGTLSRQIEDMVRAREAARPAKR